MSKNSGSDIGKGIATVAIWGGVAGLAYLFNFTSDGAIGLVVGAMLMTGALWGMDYF